MKLFSYSFNNQVFIEHSLHVHLCFKFEDTTVNSIYDVRASMGLSSSNINVYSFKGWINHYSQETVSSFHLLSEHRALAYVLVDRHSMRCGPCFQELIAYRSRQKWRRTTAVDIDKCCDRSMHKGETLIKTKKSDSAS